MIIANITAGLCNQMYFFSTAYALAREWGEELVIDPDIDGNTESTYLLDEFHMPLCKKIIYPKRYCIGKEYNTVLPKIRERAVVIDETYFEQVGEYVTIPKEKFMSEYPGKDIYLRGVFLTRQMFTKYLPELREIFTLKRPSAFVEEFEKKVQGVTPIGVHIRRQSFTVLGDDNGIDFFMAAIVFMREFHKNARFFIFSDDIGYVKENLGTADDIYYVDAMNGYRGDIEEFVCLMKCHHYILTRRSTYGRMAEILNPYEKKTSVLCGGNTWNDSEERFKFLSLEDVQRLSKLFKIKKIEGQFYREDLQGKVNGELKKELIRIGLDSEGVSLDDKRWIMYQKAQLYAKEQEYGQAVHLCRLLEDQYGECSDGFHKFFGDVLYKSGKAREALVEYARAARGKGIDTSHCQDAVFSNYGKLLKATKKKHYIIAQYRNHSTMYISQMQVIGLLLARMGNDVSFIFKRNIIKVPEGALNTRMMDWERILDNKWMDVILQNGFVMGRFHYGYPCYDYLDVLEHKNEMLHKIADKYPDEETIIVGRDPEILGADIPFQKIFVDFSEPFDEAYLKGNVHLSEIGRMYNEAGLVITRDRSYQKKGQSVIGIDGGLLEGVQWNVDVEIPCYEPTTYTEDYLDIALKIADFCN